MNFPEGNGVKEEVEQVDQNQLVLEILRSSDDAVFRAKIPTFRENAPQAVVNFQADKDAHRRSKFDHTFTTLDQLETDQLSDPDSRFVTRAAMLFHDTNPNDMAADLCKWVEVGKVGGPTAFKIAQNAWRHDFLGDNNNPKFELSHQIFQIIPDAKDREVLYAILLADIKANFADPAVVSAYAAEINRLREIEPPALPPLLDISEVRIKGQIDDSKMRQPLPNEIFSHAIFSGNQVELAQKTRDIMANVMVSGQLRSLLLINGLERMKTKAGSGGGFTTHEINVSRIDAEAKNGESYSRPELSMCAFVVRGADIIEDCLVKMLGDSDRSVNQITDEAGLVNKFSETGAAVGGEIDTQQLYFFVDLRGLMEVGNVLKLQALRTGADSQQWAKERIVLYDESSVDGLKTELTQGEIADLGDKNEACFMKNVFQEFETRSVEQTTLEKWTLSCDENLACRRILRLDFQDLVKKIATYTEVFGAMKEVKKLEEFSTVLQQRAKVFQAIETNGRYYDADTKELYLTLEYSEESWSQGKVIAIPNVISFTENVTAFSVGSDGVKTTEWQMGGAAVKQTKWEITDTIGKKITFTTEKISPNVDL